MKFENEKIAVAYNKIQDDLKTLSSEEMNKKYLGKKGLIKELLSEIANLQKEDKKTYGKEVNQLRDYTQEKLAQMSNKVILERNSDKIDPSAPFDINSETKPELLPGGSKHPIMKEMETMLNIFTNMGFDIIESRQLDDDYHMFESVNIPKGHPARDMWDTFWTEENLIPPAHTSTMQNRAMKQFGPAPVRAVIPGRCYRNEATDASHEHTFYQIEGVYVDKGITMGDMLGTIKTYLEAFFETELKIKVQPAYFPFTEPDAEFAISCPFCSGSGCNVCGHDGWMEIMGCGMIHPKVLIEAGIDPEKYSGFAWGFGLDRLVMIKYGIQDIRRFHSADLKFLQQF